VTEAAARRGSGIAPSIRDVPRDMTLAMDLRTGACLACIVATAFGCKGKEESKPPSSPSPVAAGSAAAPSEPAAPSATAPAAPAAPPARIATGEPAFGCFAWSPSLRAAACVTGTIDRSDGPPKLAVTFVGATSAPATLNETVDDAAAKPIDAALAKDGYAALPPGQKVEAGKPFDLGRGASVTVTEKETDAGGDNVAPTTKITATLTCGGKQISLYDHEDEGIGLAVHVHAVGSHVILGLASGQHREGESIDAFEAVVLDPSSCELVR